MGNSFITWRLPQRLPCIGNIRNLFYLLQIQTKEITWFYLWKTISVNLCVVIGSDVAKAFDYNLDQQIYISHGISKSNLPLHKNKPFKIVGILKKTGTPVDKTLHIPLEGMTALT